MSAAFEKHRANHSSLNTLVGHSEWVSCISFSPDGTQVATGAGDNTVKIWALER